MKLTLRKNFSYERPDIKHGYAGQTLHLDIHSDHIAIKPVTETMKRIFVGGKGFDLWLYMAGRPARHPLERC